MKQNGYQIVTELFGRSPTSKEFKNLINQGHKIEYAIVDHITKAGKYLIDDIYKLITKAEKKDSFETQQELPYDDFWNGKAYKQYPKICETIFKEKINNMKREFPHILKLIKQYELYINNLNTFIKDNKEEFKKIAKKKTWYSNLNHEAEVKDDSLRMKNYRLVSKLGSTKFALSIFGINQIRTGKLDPIWKKLVESIGYIMSGTSHSHMVVEY